MKLSEVALNDVFDTSTTGKAKYDNIMNDPETYEELGITSEIKYMSPDEAMEMMAEGQGKSVWQIVNRRKQQGGDKKVRQFAKDMSDGKKFDMPLMYFAPGGFIQDGYHRLMAANALGIKQVPVLIVHKTNHTRKHDAYL